MAPTLHTFRAEDGLVLSGWLFRPRAALGPLPTLLWLHGGPEAQERPGLPAAVPGAGRRRGGGVRAQRARLGRLRAQLRRRRRPRPPVRRDHRRARGGDVPRRSRRWPTPPAWAWRAAPTAATSRWPRWPVSRSCSPSASTCAGSPTSPRSTPRPSRGSRRRPPRSTATRPPTPSCCARCRRSTRRPDHRAAAGRARGVRHERAARGGGADRGGAARARRDARASCCSTTRATRCTAWRTARCSCARWWRGCAATSPTPWRRTAVS